MAHVIDAVIMLKDQFTATLNNVNKGIGKFAKQQIAVGKNIEKTGKSITKVGKGLTKSVTAPILALGTAAVKASIDFDNGMAKVSTIADTTQKPISKLRDEILKLSDDTGVSATELTEAEYNAISAGVDTANSVQFVGTAVKAAKGGFTDTTTAIDSLTTVLNAYNMKSTEATKISDQMLIAQNFGKTTFGEMGQSLGNVIPIASSLNVSTKDLFASIAVLTKNGIKTSESITGLKAAYSNILKPSGDAAKMAKQCGLNFSGAHLKSVGWAKFLDEVKQKTGGNTEKMAQLFGSVEALNTVMVLAGKGSKDFSSALKQMDKSSGATEKAFNKMKTPGAQLKKVLNTLKNDLIKLGDALTPMLTALLPYVSKLTNKLKGLTPAQTQTIAKFLVLAAAVGPVIAIFGKFVGKIGDTITYVGKFVNSIKKAGGIMAWLTTPGHIVVIVILAIIAVVALVYKAWTEDWGGIREKTHAVVDFIKQKIESIKETFEKVKQKCKEFADKVKEIWGNIKEFLAHPIQGTINLVKKGANAIGNAISGNTGKNALGTTYWHGGTTLVGEHGPELVELPKGSKVNDARSTSRMGGNITIAKIADSIVVREDADIDKIATAIVNKLKGVEPNLA